MTRVISIDGEDFAGRIRLRSYQFGESAFKGEVGFGGFDVDGNLTTNVLAHKLVTVVDNAASPQRIYTGYTTSRTLSRGDRFAVGNDKAWDVTLTDSNALFDDRVIRTADGSRSIETDVARVLWLLGSGYLPLDDEGVSATPTTSMDAIDYRGKYPRDVLDECAEKAGKNYFAFYDATRGRALWYDLATSSNYQSAYRISDVQADANGVTFAPRGQRRTLDPSRVYSGLRVDYATGSNTGNVFVERGAIASNFRIRERTVFDDSITSDASGSNFANAMLAMAATEEETISLEVDVPLEKVNAFMPGHRVAYKGLGTGVTAFTNYRVMRRTVLPRGGESDVEYTVVMDLTLPKITRFSGRGTKDVTGGTGGGGTTIGDAELEDDCSATVGSGIKVTPSDATVAFGRVGSWIAGNIPWTDARAGCAVGCGLFVGPQTQEMWFEFTAPVDSTTVGLLFEYHFSVAIGVAPLQRLVVGIAHAAYSGTPYGAWIPFTSISNVAQDIFVPRSVMRSGTNCLVFAPSWEANGGQSFCAEELAYPCNGPVRGGEGNSGGFEVDTFIDYTCRKLASGTSGYAPWISGLGAADGTNRTFTLIGWDGTGKPQARIGPVEIATTDLVYGATTVTLPVAPRAGSAVLFRYVIP